AILVGEVRGGEIVEAIELAPVLELDRLTAERATGKLDGAPRILRAAASVNRERTAERVEAEGRVGARDELNARNRRRREEVPVDDVPERLVDAHAVLEHRKPLGSAQERRGGETTEDDVLLIRVALCRAGSDAVGIAA